MFDKEDFGKRIKYFRKKQGKTLDTLSEAAGIGLNYLSEIEQGKHVPTLKTIVGILYALDITYNSLMYGDGDHESLIQTIQSKAKHLDEKGLALMICITRKLARTEHGE